MDADVLNKHAHHGECLLTMLLRWTAKKRSELAGYEPDAAITQDQVMLISRRASMAASACYPAYVSI